MVSVNKAVEELLKSKPFIDDGFRLGIVNYSGVARYLIPDLEKEIGGKVNPEAVIMAVKRYAEKISGKSVSEQLMEFLGECDLRLKGDMVEITLEKTAANFGLASGIYKKIDKGDVVNVYQSLTEIAILLDDKNKNLILEKSGPIHVEEDLAIITLKTPPEIIEMPGFIYYLLGLVVREGIAVVDVISTFTEFNLVVKQSDAARVYDLLFGAMKKSRNND